MALSVSAVHSLVFADMVAAFPLASNATRSNSTTGVPHHCVPEEFTRALCSALVETLQAVTIRDIGSGTLDTPGAAPPTAVTFPSTPAAVTAFLAARGWSGVGSLAVAGVFVGSVLSRAASLAMLQMNINTLLGTGVGVVGPAANPQLYSESLALLRSKLPEAFTASGFFGEGDDPAAPVNAHLEAQLEDYAVAYATAVASIVAPAGVTYVGVTTPTTPIAGVVNTGSLI